MNHAADGLLQAYMDGEVAGEAGAELDAHLSACAQCRTELDRLRRASSLFSGAVDALDFVPATTPAQAWWQVRSRARRRRLPGAGMLARAAGLLLLLSGGVMALVPESPLRRLAENLLRDDAPAVTPVAPAPAGETASAPASEDLPGVTLVPAEGRVQLRIWSIAPSATVRVDLVDGPRVSVRADGNADDVRFRSGAGRIEVMNLGSAHVSIQIPRSLPFASLEVDGRQWLFKDGEQLRLTGPVLQQAENVVVFGADR